MNLLAEIHWTEAIGFLSAGLLLGYWGWRWKEKARRGSWQEERERVLGEARDRAEALEREARLAASEEALKAREQAEKAWAARHQEMVERENRLTERENLVSRQLEGLARREEGLREEHQAIQRKGLALEEERLAVEGLGRRRREELEKAAHLTMAEARRVLLQEVEREALQDGADLTRRMIEEAKARAEEQARRVLSTAMQRYAAEHTYETTTATVALQGDDIKGRIIGREGRNIRAFEAATGVTVLIDDTPGAVVLSGFDPVRREVAREAMTRLIADGRIHPTRVEEVVTKVQAEMEETIRTIGEEAVSKAGLPPLHPEVVKLLGRLRFRYSFSQNILDHSIEVARLMALMAAEMGGDVVLAKRIGLLHDIGKAINHEVEGSHATVGADFLRRHGEQEVVVNGVAAHHGEVPSESIYGVLVGAADAISASRPGARSETMATYVKRLEDLEKIGASFPGVEKCYAVQAGRELRVMVQPDELSDHEAFALARSVTRKIENELQYPGQIRVTVIRERRCVEFAK